MTSSRKAALAVLAIAAALAALLHEPLFLGKGLGPADAVLNLSPWTLDFGRAPSNPLLADQYLSFVPLRHFARAHGPFTLWNPFVACGVPAAAWIQAASLYPINLLLGVIEPFRAAGLAAFFKLLLAGAFTFLYMRRLGASWTAALLPGLCFPLSGFMIVWLGHPHVNAACLLPALAYALERCRISKSSWKPWAALGAVYGFVLLGGHPPTAIHLTFFLLAYAGFRWRADRALWGRLGLAMLGGALLAAPQVLPYLEYRHAALAAPLADLPARAATTRLSLPTLLHWFLPFLSGSPALGYESLGRVFDFTKHDNFCERTGYVGLLPLALAFWAALRRPEGVVRFYAGCAALGLAIAYGLPPLPALLGSLPVLRDISHARLLLLVGFSLCVLAGLGLDSLLAETRRRPRAALAGACSIGGLLYLWLVYEVLRPELPRLGVEEKSFLLRQLPVFVGAAAVACLAAWRPFACRWGALCVAWAALDSLRFAWGFNPSAPRELYYPETPAIGRLKSEPGAFRVLGMGWTLLPDTALAYGLQDLRSQDVNIAMRRYEELMTGRSGSFAFYPLAPSLPPLLGELNVKYVLAEPPWAPSPGARLKKVYGREVDVYEVQGSVERALVVERHEVLSAAQILARMRSGSFDPRDAVLLEEAPLPRDAASPQGGPKGGARIVSYGPEEVRAAADSPGPAFLLLLDSYYPGWKVEVNGRASIIHRADYHFRAVEIPGGHSEVRFFYDPASVRVGWLLAALGAALLAGPAFLRRS